MLINIFYIINPSYSLTIPNPLENILPILPILTQKEEIFKEEKCYVSDVTYPITFWCIGRVTQSQ